MSWDVVLTRPAAKQMAGLPDHDREAVLAVPEELKSDFTGDIKKLKGGSGEWRVRVGDYRIRLTRDKAARRVNVVAITQRGKAYE